MDDKIIKLENYRDEMVKNLIEMCSIPAVNPKFGGAGEYERIIWLTKLLSKYSIPYEVYEVEDKNVKEQKRLNVTVKLEGTENSDKTVWFVAHMDTVGAGDLALWNSDPFKPVIKDGKIYGRGVEDNGQAVISTLYTCLVLKENDIRPKCNVGFAFVSDEESGSQYGLKELVRKGIFGLNDEAIVPDAGSPDGTFIEIAEKSMVWMKFTVIGKEAHASTPNVGINASSVGCRFAVELEDLLKELYAERDSLFNPPYSTFEVTQKFANVESPNVLPGKDVFVMDMRILPGIKIGDVVREIDRVAARYEYRYKVNINYEFLQRVDAPKPTPPDARIVVNLVESLKELGITPRVGGIGGGTCAAILREVGIPTVVWSTVDETAHQPNEYTVIDNILTDTKVFISTIMKYM